MKFPIKYQKNSTGQAFSGFQTFSTAASETRVNMTFDPAFYQITSALPLDELSVNQNSSSEEAILDLAAVELKSSAEDMADDLGTLFYGTGTGDNPAGLGNIVDDGTVAPSYGGLSRSAYPTIKATKTASGGTLTLQKMATLYNNITSGSQKPTIGVTTEAIFALYESLLTPMERINKDASMMKLQGNMAKANTGMIGGTGFTGLDYKGIPILADEKCTTGNLYFLNENYLNWFALPVAMTEPVKFKSADIEGNDYSSVEGLGFSWTNWIKPTNAASIISHIYFGGQLICDNPKRQGVLTGVSST